MQRKFIPFLGIVLLIIYPLWLNEFLVSVSIITGIYIVLLTGLALFLGYGGQFSFAQAVFYGLGAYTSAILTTKYHVPVSAAFLASGVLAGVVGYILSAPILRLRGYYLAVQRLPYARFFMSWLSNSSILRGLPGFTVSPCFLFLALSSRQP
jgi:branched-chain amino acid transport system permease protein